ncbi:ankyrin repeat [Purpureocillium takamizusanense]|uniref:Ankyrin repeat n=1 Tax=Purpureocillium takamizusanense TaxID=2060973 RepID=A0A9Q8V998_9HYPO|nr:ankyrin repeat [Purpureocillium takamizusanense]UNI17508.1 ankyrin repeat [Purpureocillium takamizusanense]
MAAESNCLAVAEVLIDAGRADMEAVNVDGFTPPQLAVVVDAVPFARLLIERGANTDVKFLRRCNLASLAVTFSSLGCIKFLVEAARVEPRVQRLLVRPLLLLFAIERGETAIANYLLLAGAATYESVLERMPQLPHRRQQVLVAFLLRYFDATCIGPAGPGDALHVRGRVAGM